MYGFTSLQTAKSLTSLGHLVVYSNVGLSVMLAILTIWAHQNGLAALIKHYLIPYLVCLIGYLICLDTDNYFVAREPLVGLLKPGTVHGLIPGLGWSFSHFCSTLILLSPITGK